LQYLQLKAEIISRNYPLASCAARWFLKGVPATNFKPQEFIRTYFMYFICISLVQFLCKVNKFHRPAAQILCTPSSATHIILYFKYIDSAKSTEQISNSMKKHLSQERNNYSASIKMPCFMEPKDSLLYKQQPTTDPTLYEIHFTLIYAY
jgi:hypothetical protein